MEVMVDGVSLFVKPVGSEKNHPLILLHGGPGLDHTELHPYFDVLADWFWLLYLDQRGQGRSQRVDPSTLTPSLFAKDVTGLATALDLKRYAVLGHSYGAIVALAHAIEQRGATHYVVSHGAASGKKMMRDVQASLQTFEPVELRDQVIRSWESEPYVATPEECAEVIRLQMPFHFAKVDSEAYRAFMERPDETIYAPEVLAYTASQDYPLEYESRLKRVNRPTLIVTGLLDRASTPRTAEEMHTGIQGSELVILADAAHMSYLEQPDAYFSALRNFFARHPLAPAS
jgi:proline iminopeptidase